MSSELIQDPTTGRGFVFSKSGSDSGCPEFLFLDTPCDSMPMVRCSRIISDYQKGNTSPRNLEIVTKLPMEDDLELIFVARVLTGENNALKRSLERNYLYQQQAVHGLVVMVPHMPSEVRAVWGSNREVGPATDVATEAGIDEWIASIERRTGACRDENMDVLEAIIGYRGGDEP